MDPVEHFSQQGFIQFLAIEPVHAGSGTATIRLTPKPEHLNHNGTVNAAVLYGLAEVAGAGAVVADMLELAAESYTVVKKATIEYLAPARGVIEASGRVDAGVNQWAKEEVASCNAVEIQVPVSVRDPQGTEVATVEFTLAIRPKRKTVWVRQLSGSLPRVDCSARVRPLAVSAGRYLVAGDPSALVRLGYSDAGVFNVA